MANQSQGSPAGTADFLPVDAKPPLQRALETLSVNLEDELVRYRQGRAGNGATQPYSNSQIKFRSKRRRRGLNLIQVPARPVVPPQGSAPSPVAAAAAGVPGSTPHAAVSLGVNGASATVAESSAQASGVRPPLPPNPRLQQSLAYQGGPIISTGNPQAPATQTTAPDNALQRRGGSLTPYHAVPDDYLESTEALLDSLPGPYDYAEGYEDVEYEPTLREQLSTPLGIGALLLLLVGSAGFGYAVTSPKTAEFLRTNALVQMIRGNGADPEAAPPVAAPAPAASKQPEPATGLQGIGPDLSKDEFKELDLGGLSTLNEAEAIPGGARSPVRSGAVPLDIDPESSSRPGMRATDAVPDNSVETVAPRPTPTATPTPVVRPQVPADPVPARPPATPQPQERNAAPPQTATPVPTAIPAPQPVNQAPPQPVAPSAPAAPSSAAPTPPAAAPVAPPQPLGTNPTPQPLPQPQTAPPAPLSQASDPSPAPTQSTEESAAPGSITAPAPITQPPPQPIPGN